MKAADLQGKSVRELREMETELHDELFRLRMKHFTGQLQRVSDLKERRRDIARVKTILRQKTQEA